MMVFKLKRWSQCVFKGENACPSVELLSCPRFAEIKDQSDRPEKNNRDYKPQPKCIGDHRRLPSLSLIHI